MVGYIYLIRNDVNDKLYVGQTIRTPNYRFRQHCRAYRSQQVAKGGIDDAIGKIGEKHFSYEVLERCPVEKLNNRERYWIKFYNCVEDGYNLKHGGRGPGIEKIQSDEQLQAIYKDYIEGMTLKEIEEKHHVQHGVMYRIFAANGLPKRGSNTETCRQWSIRNFKLATLARQVPIKNIELDITYPSKKEALVDMIEKGYSSAVDWHNIRAGLDSVLKGKQEMFLGFHWKEA